MAYLEGSLYTDDRSKLKFWLRWGRSEASPQFWITPVEIPSIKPRLSNHEERRLTLPVLSADRWCVAEHVMPLSSTNFPFLLVIADTEVDLKSKQGYYNIQMIIWSSAVKWLSHQTFCWQRAEDWLASTGHVGQHSSCLGSRINAFSDSISWQMGIYS